MPFKVVVGGRPSVFTNIGPSPRFHFYFDFFLHFYDLACATILLFWSDLHPGDFVNSGKAFGMDERTGNAFSTQTKFLILAKRRKC